MLRSIRRIIRRVSQYSRDLSGHIGLTVPQLMCLKAIAETEAESVTVSQVSRRVSLSPATVSRIVDRLVRKGLVERQRGESDRRKVYVTLTVAGLERYQTLPTPLDERFIERLERLPEHERLGLLTALERIVQLMDAESIDAAPMLVDGDDVKGEPFPGP
jgi:DNA-binding MarR family transcriptional regulator